MDDKMMEQVLNKPPEQITQNGIKVIARAENGWFLLPKATRESILIETVDCATIASRLPLAEAFQTMLRVGYYYGRRNK